MEETKKVVNNSRENLEKLKQLAERLEDDHGFTNYYNVIRKIRETLKKEMNNINKLANPQEKVKSFESLYKELLDTLAGY